MSQHLKPPMRRESGFTIIEFMIATVVFSVVILLVSASIIQISKQYQRSMNVGRTQAAARTLLESISESIQFGSTVPSDGGTDGDGTKSLCVGNRQFLYVLGKKVADSGGYSTKSAVQSRIWSASCATVGITTGTVVGSELLGPGLRLASLNYTGVDDFYTIKVRVTYGDDDLLCSPSAVAGSCNSGAAAMTNLTDFQQPDLRCKSGAGSEYCAVSELSTTVQKRMGP